MKTDDLIKAFAQKIIAAGVPVCEQDNRELLANLERHLPKRLPQSFEQFLSQYSFPSFDVGAITLFAWGPALETNEYFGAALGKRGSLSELLIPAGLFQIGRPNTGNFDAVCFDLNDKAQNREHRLVRADHEEILCNLRVRITSEPWASFRELAANTIAGDGSSIFYETIDF